MWSREGMTLQQGWVAAFALGILVIPIAADAQERLGGEFQVNTYTTSTQVFPVVSVDGEGNFVVLWSSDGPDGGGFGIFGQRFAADGRPLGGEFQANAYTTGFQGRPWVARSADGTFAVVWASNNQDGNGYGVFGQRFLANALPSGPEFQVNSHTTAGQRFPSMAMDADGDFIVVWQSFGQDLSENGVFGQRFSSSGPEGFEFRVNSYTPNDQEYPSVAMDPDGDFVVVWASSDQDGSSYGVFGQRFTSTGASAGDEFQVNTFTTSSQRNPSVAMDAAGNFVVVWDSLGQDGASDGIFGQRFSSSGVELGPEFAVNTHTTSDQRLASVAMDDAGKFVVVWQSRDGQDGSDYGVFGQRFTSDGNRLGGEFQVNAYTTGAQVEPSVAMDDAGNFVVVWSGEYQDGDGFGIFGQRFRFGELDFFIGDDEAPAGQERSPRPGGAGSSVESSDC